MEIGQICMKLAGRDAGRACVIVDLLEDNYVLIEGDVRRRKCNINHLSLTSKVIKIKKNASATDVKKEFEKLGLGFWETKPKKAGDKPKKVRKGKTPEEKEQQKQEKKAKKAAQKIEVTEEKKEEPKEKLEDMKGIKEEKKETKAAPKAPAKPAEKKEEKKPAAKK